MLVCAKKRGLDVGSPDFLDIDITLTLFESHIGHGIFMILGI
jgi:hypothetical protein